MLSVFLAASHDQSDAPNSRFPFRERKKRKLSKEKEKELRRPLVDIHRPSFWNMHTSHSKYHLIYSTKEESPKVPLGEAGYRLHFPLTSELVMSARIPTARLTIDHPSRAKVLLECALLAPDQYTPQGTIVASQLRYLQEVRETLAAVDWLATLPV
jgi:hypothetical protein